MYVPEHLTTTSSGSMMILEPHTGHFLGGLNNFDRFLFLSNTTFKICGITSPALSITTVSPSLMSFFSISSKLCRVAFETKTPPILIDSSLATGVTEPVRPICISIFLILVLAVSEANLCAIAHLGVLPTVPNLL